MRKSKVGILLITIILAGTSQITFARQNGQYICENTQASDHDITGAFIENVATDLHKTTISQSKEAISVTYGAPGSAFTTNYVWAWQSLDGKPVFEGTSSHPASPLNWQSLILTDAGHLTVRPTLSGYRLFFYQCNKIYAEETTSLQHNQQDILTRIQEIKNSWINVQKDLREGEFCKIQGAKIKFNNSKISECSLSKIDHLQTVLSVFEGELEFTTYLQANLVLQNGVQDR